MKLIVLTGGIACGKTTCSQYLKQHYGIPIVDSDEITHNVQQKGEIGYNKIVAEFGKGILNEDGSINRKELGSIVFKNVEQRRKLNSINIHLFIKPC